MANHTTLSSSSWSYFISDSSSTITPHLNGSTSSSSSSAYGLRVRASLAVERENKSKFNEPQEEVFKKINSALGDLVKQCPEEREKTLRNLTPLLQSNASILDQVPQGLQNIIIIVNYIALENNIIARRMGFRAIQDLLEQIADLKLAEAAEERAKELEELIKLNTDANAGVLPDHHYIYKKALSTPPPSLKQQLLNPDEAMSKSMNAFSLIYILATDGELPINYWRDRFMVSSKLEQLADQVYMVKFLVDKFPGLDQDLIKQVLISKIDMIKKLLMLKAALENPHGKNLSETLQTSPMLVFGQNLTITPTLKPKTILNHLNAYANTVRHLLLMKDSITMQKLLMFSPALIENLLKLSPSQLKDVLEMETTDLNNLLLLGLKELRALIKAHDEFIIFLKTHGGKLEEILKSGYSSLRELLTKSPTTFPNLLSMDQDLLISILESASTIFPIPINTLKVIEYLWWHGVSPHAIIRVINRTSNATATPPTTQMKPQAPLEAYDRQTREERAAPSRRLDF